MDISGFFKGCPHMRGGEPVDRPRLISDWLYERAGEKIKGIQAVTLDQIRAVLEIGFEVGEGVWDLSQRIEALGLEEIIPHRSEVIARTETMYVGNMGGARSDQRIWRRASPGNMEKVDQQAGQSNQGVQSKGLIATLRRMGSCGNFIRKTNHMISAEKE